MRAPTLTRALVLTAALVLPSSVALAQDNPLQLVVSAIRGAGGERTEQEVISRGFGSADCDALSSAEIEIAAPAGAMVPSNTLDLWVTTDDTACNTVEARDADMGECDHVGAATLGATDNTFTVGLADIEAATMSAICETTAAAGVRVRIFALATGDSPSRSDVMDNWGRVTVLVDPVGPSGPEISGSGMVAGDTEVTISWTPVTDTNPTYVIYQGGPCAGGDGGVADGGTGSLRQVKEAGVGARSTTIDPEADLMLEVGESAQVFVRAVDEAGNEGALSAPVCVTREPVVGFCDRYGECDANGCSATGAPARQAPLALLLLATILHFRKRR